ncbi:hypothetical protein QEN19_002306 [Hanseniaspora menglaensis]
MDNTPVSKNYLNGNVSGISAPPETPLNDNKTRYTHKKIKLNSVTKSNPNHRHFSFHNSGSKIGQKIFGHGKTGVSKRSPILISNSNNGPNSPLNLLTPFKTTKYLFHQDSSKGSDSKDTELLTHFQEWRDSAMSLKEYATVDFVNEKICAHILEKEEMSFIKGSIECIEEFYQLINCKFLMKQYLKVVDLFENNKSVSTIINCHLPSIFLVGQSLFEMGRFEESLEFIGDGEEEMSLSDNENRTKLNLFSPPDKENTNTDKLIINMIKPALIDSRIESSLCCLRAKVMIKLNQFDAARIQLQKASVLNVQNYESFQLLVDHEMLKKSELLKFYNTLPFKEQIFDNNFRELIKALYYKQLSYNVPLVGSNHDENEIQNDNEEYEEQQEESEPAISFYDDDEKSIIKDHNAFKDILMNHKRADILIATFNLANNRETQVNKIKKFYRQCKYLDCVKKCEIFMKEGLDSYNESILVYYISSLFEINNKSKLFRLVNDLIINFPREWITEFASATHQLCLKKPISARKHFAKATILNPNSLASWIGYGHTFVAELEHEQAIVVYSTAAKLFPGSSIPLIFIGMQYIAMESYLQSEQHFKMALEIDDRDPLLLNELGVIYYQQSDFVKAKKYFKKAYELVTNIMTTETRGDLSKFVNPHCSNKSWNGIFVNLGHTYRKLNDLKKALMCFEMVNDNSVQNTNILTSMALICLKLCKLEKCIDYLHRALSVSPNNTMAKNLLDKAMELNCGD